MADCKKIYIKAKHIGIGNQVMALNAIKLLHKHFIVYTDSYDLFILDPEIIIWVEPSRKKFDWCWILYPNFFHVIKTKLKISKNILGFQYRIKGKYFSIGMKFSKLFNCYKHETENNKYLAFQFMKTIKVV